MHVPQRQETREVSVHDLVAALGTGATLVDVREADEYVRGHVPGARSIPMGQLGARLSELGDGPVHLICATGNRSLAMVRVLEHAGLASVSVAGGTAAWVRAGGTVSTGTRP